MRDGFNVYFFIIRQDMEVERYFFLKEVFLNIFWLDINKRRDLFVYINYESLNLSSFCCRNFVKDLPSL